MPKRILIAAVALAGALLLVLGINTLHLRSVEEPVSAAAPWPGEPRDAAHRLARLLTFPTVAKTPSSATEPSPFLALHRELETLFPAVHRDLELEVVEGLSLLYRWPGRVPDLAPGVLMAHQDVVPVEAATEAAWTHPPFAGVVADGYVWGRGAMDDKLSLYAILEAVEGLLNEGFRPLRTLYLAFGHDEEVGGESGARNLAARLAEREPRELAFVLDEGGLVAEGFFPGIDRPVALIGTAEKGFLSLELIARGTGGHASAPPRHSSVGRLAAAVTRMEDHPFPARLSGTASRTFAALAPEMPFVPRMLFANAWLFEPILISRLTSGDETAAMLRTTTAVTVFEGGEKDNVLPQRARAVVNLRIVPGETAESVTRKVEEIVADPAIEVRPLPGRPVQEPSPESPSDSPVYLRIARTIRSVLAQDPPLPSPFLMIGGTDSRYFTELSGHVYRFLPLRVDRGELVRFHGTDERVAVEGVATAIQFYREWIVHQDDLDPGSAGPG